MKTRRELFRLAALLGVAGGAEMLPERSAAETLAAAETDDRTYVDKLNKEVNAALDDPKMKTRLADLGVVALPGFGNLIAEEIEKWAKVIRAANIKAE